MPVTLRELAERFGCELHGDGEIAVSRVGTLSGAGPDAVSFLANPAFRRQLGATRAAAVILEERYRGECPVASLVTPKPYVTYARVAALLAPPRTVEPGVHPSAVVGAGSVLGPGAAVGPQAAIGAGCRIGAGVVVGAGCVIGDGVEIGAESRLAPRVTVLEGARIGERCILHPGVVIGADGFGFAHDGGQWVKIPQTGGVVIGNDVEIGANTTIDRGAIEDTVIEDGVKIDNLVQIAHNVRIGAHTVMAGMSGVAGSTRIGRRCMIAGGAVVSNALEICDDVVITIRSIVTRSIDAPGTYSGALPAEVAPEWRRNAVRFKHLDALAERLRAVERALARRAGEQEQDDEQ